MRFHSLPTAAASIVLLVACKGVRHSSADRNPEPADDPVLSIFSNRELISHKVSAGEYDSVKAMLNGSPVGQVYVNAHPERSVLLYDCGQANDWCSTPEFSFQRMFQIAARFANLANPDAETLAQKWLADASNLDGVLSGDLSFGSLADAPLQLLAVANRLDMATFDGSNWTGAEVHLVYGLTPADGAAPKDLTLIFEFVRAPVPENVFQGIAKSWLGLRSYTPDQSASHLIDTMSTTGIPLSLNGDVSSISLIRIRMNHFLQGPTWRLTQHALSSGSPYFVQKKLDDQISASIRSDVPEFLKIWNAADANIKVGDLEYSIPDFDLEAASSTYAQGYGFPTPKTLCSPPPNLVTRNVLGLQECKMCHTAETATDFRHIPNRATNASASPSGFLAGPQQPGTLHPALIDLYTQRAGVVWPVTVTYEAYTAGDQGGCTIVGHPSTTRYFHDVARRTIFLAAESLGALVDAERHIGQLSTLHVE